METKINKFFNCEIKGVDDAAQTVTAVVSSKKVDRDNDVIVPEAFSKRLKLYKEHPVLLSSHRYDSVLRQIGEATKIGVTESGLEATFKYYTGQGNPEADWAWVLAKQGIAAFSIGFMAHEWEDIKDKESGYTIGRKFTDVELMEISQVLIPSNRDALQNSASARIVEGELCELATKSFDSGALKTPEPPKEKHYSDLSVPDPGEKAKANPKPISKDAISGIVKDILK